MKEQELTVCFSGHRPEKLPNYPQLLAVTKSMLYFHIEEAVREGYTRFISGLARGVDLWAAMYVLELKRQHPNLRLICVKPTESHGAQFNGEDRYLLSSVIERADECICTDDGLHENCYKKRNRYMIEHSDKLIAVVNQYRSGTGQTIAYARKRGLKLCIIDLRKVSAEGKGTLPLLTDGSDQDGALFPPFSL